MWTLTKAGVDELVTLLDYLAGAFMYIKAGRRYRGEGSRQSC